MDTQLIDWLLRSLHFAAGIVWIGHNYANVVQRPAWRPLAREDLIEPDSPGFMARLNREHGMFRWAAVVTWVAGMLLLWRKDWLVLWPHQKKVLGFTPAPLEERIRCARITFLSSRTNTMLSIPLLVFMASAHHGGALAG